MLSAANWRFFTDRVMGGLSSGRLDWVTEGGQTHARLTGHVSTANRGGFIQMRHDLPRPPQGGTTGLRLVVRGNDQRYFAHLRTTASTLPWQYFQAGFDVTGDWSTVLLPLTAFAPAPGVTRPGDLTSVGVVAYGRDHDASLDLREIGFY